MSGACSFNFRERAGFFSVKKCLSSEWERGRLAITCCIGALQLGKVVTKNRAWVLFCPPVLPQWCANLKTCTSECVALLLQQCLGTKVSRRCWGGGCCNFVGYFAGSSWDACAGLPWASKDLCESRYETACLREESLFWLCWTLG